MSLKPLQPATPRPLKPVEGQVPPEPKAEPTTAEREEHRKFTRAVKHAARRTKRWLRNVDLQYPPPLETVVSEDEDFEPDTNSVCWLDEKDPHTSEHAYLRWGKDSKISSARFHYIGKADYYRVRNLEPIEQHPLFQSKALLQPRDSEWVVIEGSTRLGVVVTKENMTAASPARSGVSPSSSPRLPSPPPMPELQFGPQSPSIGSVANDLQLDAATKQDDSAGRRIRPGTKAGDMARGPPRIPLSQLDSPFQLQEHLKAEYATLTHSQDGNHTVPITRDTAYEIARPPMVDDSPVDKNLWLYELCRFLVLKANLVSVSLMADSPPCSSATCPEMRASEWQYLCAVHEPPKSCCAIDYCNHTLDWAANVLTSPKHFPSRLQLGGDSGNVFQSMRQLTNIFRRVYRIFAHAWFQHRDIFWNVEAVYGIYVLFKTVCDEYQLIPDDNYTIPPEAEGPRDDTETPINPSTIDPTQMQILRKENDTPSNNGQQTSVDQGPNATRRHKHTPSTGSHVTTIAESHEEEEEPKEATNTSPPKVQKPTDRSHIQPLGRLDISSTVPPYTLRQPEDPTPTTATAYTRDPLADAGSKSNTFESEVRSPGGGSFRTGGPDMLSAILGHLDESNPENSAPASEEKEDNNEESEGDVTAIAIEEKEIESKPEPPKTEQPQVEEDNDNETMERIEMPSYNTMVTQRELEENEIEPDTSKMAKLTINERDDEPQKASDDLSKEQNQAPAGVA